MLDSCLLKPDKALDSPLIAKDKSFCKICSKVNKCKIIKVKQTGKTLPEEFDYVFCKSCNSLTIKEIPTNLSEYYKDYYSLRPFTQKPLNSVSFYLKQLSAKMPSPLNNLAFYSQHSIDSLPLHALFKIKPCANSKILDVGCGTGKFVYDLHNLGFHNAIGIDPFIKSDIQYKNGAKIFKKDLKDIDEKFDIIVFNHTFEHFLELDSPINFIKSNLDVNGTCIIRIPNIDSYSFKQFGANWTGIHAPYHLYLPSYKAVTYLFGKAGMQISFTQGEQLYHFLLSNIDNSFDLIYDTRKMFREFSKIHTKFDLKYAKKKSKQILKQTNLCEWLAYYIKFN